MGRARSAAEQMACDEALARDAEPTTRCFLWDPPAISFGWKQALPYWFDRQRCAAAGLEAVERPTGGGIAFHGSDLSLSVIAPRAPGLSLAALTNAVCQSAVRLCRAYGAEAGPSCEERGKERVTYCLCQESHYAVLVGGRKVGGFALRRYPEAWLIQGSLLIQPLPRALSEAIPDEVRRQLAARAIPLSETASSSVTASAAAARWAESWSEWWDAVLPDQASGHKLQAAGLAACSL